MTISWLHLSDVHECDRDSYHRNAMYGQIVEAVRNRTPPPDLVFLTGDLAFAGTEAEYTLLKQGFFDAFKEALPADCPIFMVPGNHDVDRDSVVPPRFWMADEKQAKLFQEVGRAGARKRQDTLLPRFAGYRAFDRNAASWGEDWLASERGSVCHQVEVGARKLAIVGINTAWLCQDDADWGQLTAGRTMVEAALDEAQKSAADLIVVLGHHPLDAMAGEQAWSDGPRIRERLQQANAVYLHGHLHASGRDTIGDSLQSVLAIQAPSAFQAGDNSRWRNGLLWGEVDLDDGWLILEPWLWNDQHREYKFDNDSLRNRERVPGRDAFRLRLPGRAPAAPPGIVQPPDDPPSPTVPPPGWCIHNQESLTAFAADCPDAETMAAYFDGSFPTWRVALADGLRQRQVVEATIRRFRDRHQGAPRPLALLLTGAGGEGKSTALLQVAASLVRDAGQSWSCLHREASAAPIPEDLLQRLDQRPGHAWIVALDDADNAASGLVAALKRIAPRTDVHLLMAAREAEWSIQVPTREIWQGVADFRQEAMPGLDEADATRIVEGWRAFGDVAMGRLRGVEVAAAAKALHGHANEHAARPGEGALLGALLFTRQGEELKDRVRELVAPLKGTGGTKAHDLRDIYAMIAAMHAENQLYLSRPVLLAALGCNDRELDRVLHILRREAMLDTGETFILTRHRRIAETACEALRDDGYDIDKWFPFLGRAAEISWSRHGAFVPVLDRWRFRLAEHFVKKGTPSWPLARHIGKALHDANPQDPKGLVAYVNVLREAGAPGDAMAVLKEKARPFRTHRSVLFEWSVVAGTLGDFGLAAWLAARSLADGGDLVDALRCKLSLSGLGQVLGELHKLTGDRALASGRAACGRLGLRLPDLDATTRGYFMKHLEAEPQADRAEPSLAADIERLCQAVIEAANHAEPANDPSFFEDLLGDPETYRFSGLSRVMQPTAPARRLGA